MTKEKVCIAIDVGGTNLRFCLVDQAGKLLFRERQSTEINRGRDDFLARLYSSIDYLKKKGTAEGWQVVGIGVGVPGLISNEGLVYSSVNLQPLEGLNLRQLICQATGLPTIVVNDANAWAWGEKCFGAGKGMASFLMLTLGTGVGSGLVLNDRLWTGVDGVAAEFGHATVEPEGRLCRCGNHGCLEQYSSASAIVSATMDALHRGGSSCLTHIPPAEITSAIIAEAAAKGDSLARSIFEQAGRYLGIASALVANLLNLDGIILGGGVAASFDLIAEPMRREIAARAFPIPARRLKVIKSELGDDAGILGAAAMAMASI
ncbi:ROK family protein [Geotalea toluenoxydans]|uniref:ROK family protein n=1 Tax=Geotalea toluenoxydans TaxID=421624 RepID=UPI0006D125D2|nr:ROK family protein [Geotalea toluenoxydans]